MEQYKLQCTLSHDSQIQELIKRHLHIYIHSYTGNKKRQKNFNGVHTTQCTYTVAVAYANCPRECYTWWACLWILWHSTINLFVMSAQNCYTLSTPQLLPLPCWRNKKFIELEIHCTIHKNECQCWATIPLEFWCGYIEVRFRKAFDSVPHEPLLSKLKELNLAHNVYVWLHNYLANR